jgi:hypothetical protein
MLLATVYGVKIENVKLNGVFQLKRDLDSQVSNSIRNVYTAQTNNSELKKPEGIEELKWLSIDKALKQITFPHIKIQISQIMNNPNKIWAGSMSQFKLNGNWETKILQEFYIISDEVTNNVNSSEKKIDNYTIQWLLIF